MKTFIQGAIFGAILTAAVAGGYAYGTGHNNQTEVRPGTLPVDAQALGQCQTRVGFGRMTTGDSCFSNEVMVGSRSGYILCSDITVTCN